MFHVVDDTKFVSEVVSETLKKLGHNALEFNCPREYLVYASSPDYIEPRAVFADAVMPVVDGYEMIDTLSGLRSGLTFVVMSTGKAIKSDRNNACLHLPKPFRLDDIRNVVDALINP